MHNPFLNDINRPTRNLPKQNNHLHAIRPNEINHPRPIWPNETVGAVPVCPPERPRSGVSILEAHALCMGMNDGCAPAGRLGRAHRHCPYQSPSYFSTQSHTNQITIYMQSAPTASTVPRAIHPNETVGAVPMCPPERPHSGVSITKIHALYAGNLTMDAPLWGDTGGHIGTAPTKLHHIFPRNPIQTK